MNIVAKLINVTGGYEVDRDNAKKYLILGNQYEVERIDIHSSCTDVYLKGVNAKFNSVNFEFYKDGRLHCIFSDPEINTYLSIYGK